MNKLLKSLLALTVAGVLVTAAHAQSAPKICVVDMVKLYDGHYKTKEQNVKLQADQKTAEDELQKLNDQGNKLVSEAKAIQAELQNPALADKAKADDQKALQAKAEEIQSKQNDVNAFRVNTQRALQQRINTFKQMLLGEISAVAVEVAKSHGATIVLDKSGPSLIGISPVLYADSSYDITDEVAAKILKQRGSDSDSSSAAAPAATSAAAPSVSFPGAK